MILILPASIYTYAAFTAQSPQQAFAGNTTSATQGFSSGNTTSATLNPNYTSAAPIIKWPTNGLTKKSTIYDLETKT